MNYRANYRKCEFNEAPTSFIKHYLGEEDGDIEWGQDFEEAYKCFLNIDAYKEFQQKAALLLIGRTGTGKSSILNCYRYQVKRGKSQDCDAQHVIKLELEKYILELAKSVVGKNISDSYIQRDFEDNIDIYIHLEIMKKIVSCEYLNDKSAHEEDLKTIQSYLNNNTIKENVDFLGQLTEDVNFVNANAGKVMSAVTVVGKVVEKYRTTSYTDAVKALYRCLSNNNFLVLIDSMDTYDMTDLPLVLATKALVETSFNFYRKYKTHHIKVKVALPAEIYSYIEDSIPEKHQRNTVVIEWRYKDLLKMIALKVYSYQRRTKDSVLNNFQETFTYKDFYNNYESAKSYLKLFIPENCQTNISLSFDTLAYCIRHTQKKPRQLMAIFNVFIHALETHKNEYYLYDNSQRIGDYIHTVQKDMIYDALNMFNAYTENKIVEISRNILAGIRVNTKRKEFINHIKQAASIYQNLKHKLSDQEVFEYLIASGIIGKKKREDIIDAHHHILCNSEPAKIITTIFEYQVKGRLSFSHDDEVIIHPMCYEFFSNEIDYNALVYPSPANDSDDVLWTLIPSTKGPLFD